MTGSIERRKVVLAITGSIAAYKSAELARMFVSRGFEVRVVMTQSAKEFITPLTMQAITGHPVLFDFWSEASMNIDHIELADWADAVVVAPATADAIAKIAHGFADSVPTAVVLATRAPVLIAPAMNVNMLEHEATQSNIKILRARGVNFVEPESGDLACGWKGRGRLAHPWEIFSNVRRILSPLDFSGKRILITAGPTREAIDPVRFVSNRSSGKMGAALARHAYRRGAEVTLIHGPVKLRVPRSVNCIEVVSAEDMHREVMRNSFFSEGKDAPRPDIIIMTAAVADYRVKDPAAQKLKKEAGLSLSLIRNIDILQDLGDKKPTDSKVTLVGFAVETGEIEDLLAEARRKLETKNADMIIGNFAQEAFDLDTNRVWIVDRYGKQEEVATNFKGRVANKILDAISRIC